ncbi:hypothetical protein BV394_11995 [Brevirhabdus pacifica]|uniref:Methyltransferase n=2 Tax=Brevirhabdus pacifica TaxID=1267768 RepID=A0A1U7DK46_9RHOB|nr:DUF938 domain-containing protein [Brevirhabdus pacifica]APX90360.1 hypothetical protein BV394_11995 [Brevirhabdus pacifica]OWU78608.1 hypothetical protein ATO5_07460 [Loktanella sp. 22II-4b]
MSREKMGAGEIPVADEAGRLFAPSAARNAEAIARVVARHAPAAGLAVEIASGTGQHVVRLAGEHPDLEWQPTDIDETRLRSINARAEAAGLENLRPAVHFDAVSDTWSEVLPGGGAPDMVLLVNLLHLVPEAEARAILQRVGEALAHGGIFVLYGPFRREGRFVSQGDSAFDHAIRLRQPGCGYKDTLQIMDWARAARLQLVERVEMPASNLTFVFRR